MGGGSGHASDDRYNSDTPVDGKRGVLRRRPFLTSMSSLAGPAAQEELPTPTPTPTTEDYPGGTEVTPAETETPPSATATPVDHEGHTETPALEP